MRGPYGFELNESCRTCRFRSAGFFCQLSPSAIKDLDAVKSLSAYPAGAVLFMEKQDSRGIFVLCQGQAKLTISSSEGKVLIVRIARPGEVLGLMATLSGKPYEVTAETLHACQVAFVRRDNFLRVVSRHPDVYLGVVRQLTTLYDAAYDQLRMVGLALSAPGKLAKLLLDWSITGEPTAQGSGIKFSLTHEEIAEFIGSSRETVTRTLSDFKNQHLVSLQGSTLMISNRAALETLASV
jgi:CRP/FNR family cyclic AMP-dependent transcriptional regulator